jgi:hypothetical protein
MGLMDLWEILKIQTIVMYQHVYIHLGRDRSILELGVTDSYVRGWLLFMQ